MLIESSPDWKLVENAKTLKKKCPRCNNITDFYLVNTKKHGIHFAGISLFRFNTVYVIHCSICIYYESASKTLRNNLMEK